MKNFAFRKIPLALGFIAALGLCLASSSPALGQATTTVTTTQRIPVGGSFTNTCNGDFCTWSGTENIVSVVTIAADGSGHVEQHITFPLTFATGVPSGLTYSFPGTMNVSHNFSAVPSEFTETLSCDLVAQGGGPGSNLVMTFTIHVTVNANGTTTSTVVDFRFACR